MSSARRLLTTLLIGIAVAACNSESDTPPTPSATVEPTQQPLPSPTNTQAETQLLAPTSTPLPSPTSASRPTRTPYPIPGDGDGTDEPPEDYILPGDWLYAPFTDASGTERTLEDFLGRGVVVQITSSTCDLCVEQHEFLLAAIQDRYDLDLLPDTVFILLSINQQETPGLIGTVLQNELPESWPTVELLDDPDVSADWLTAVASPELVDALALAFGPHVRTVSELTTIVVQPDGLAFQFTGTLTNFNTLRDAISAYGNPPIR